MGERNDFEVSDKGICLFSRISPGLLIETFSNDESGAQRKKERGRRNQFEGIQVELKSGLYFAAILSSYQTQRNAILVSESSVMRGLAI